MLKPPLKNLATIIGVLLLLAILNRSDRIVNKTWSYTVVRYYRVLGETVIRRVQYNHARVDGLLLHHILQKGALPLPCAEKPADQCSVWCRVCVDAHNINCSPFLALVSYICAKTSMRRKKQRLNTIIYVACRDKLELFTQAGVFVKTVSTQIDHDWSMQRTADAHAHSILEARSSSRSCDTLIQRIRAFNADLIFNKWMLDRILRNDGKILQLIRGGRQVDIGFILGLTVPMELKCVQEDHGVWSILATPLVLCLPNRLIVRT